MARARPGVSTQNLKEKAPHQHNPLPDLPHKAPKPDKKKPAEIPANKRK